MSYLIPHGVQEEPEASRGIFALSHTKQSFGEVACGSSTNPLGHDCRTHEQRIPRAFSHVDPCRSTRCSHQCFLSFLPLCFSRMAGVAPSSEPTLQDTHELEKGPVDSEKGVDNLEAHSESIHVKPTSAALIYEKLLGYGVEIRGVSLDRPCHPLHIVQRLRPARNTPHSRQIADRFQVQDTFFYLVFIGRYHPNVRLGCWVLLGLESDSGCLNRLSTGALGPLAFGLSARDSCLVILFFNLICAIPPAYM